MLKHFHIDQDCSISIGTIPDEIVPDGDRFLFGDMGAIAPHFHLNHKH